VTARVAILASGAGSNAGVLIDAASRRGFPACVACVVCDVPGAGVIKVARQAGVPVHVVASAGRSREDFEREVLHRIGPGSGDAVDLVCLAGFMRVLTPAFVRVYAHRILNVHPSMLPAFPGLHAHRQVLAAGVPQSGATVHLVDEGLDTGPILAQASVPVLPEDDEASLGARVRAVEHRLYPMVLRWVAEGRVRVDGNRAHVDLRRGEARWFVGAVRWSP
jgi:phosphoribosylglycinamide formyltransferase-1